MYKFPWWDITKPEEDGGVYELREYRVQSGNIPAWANLFSAALPGKKKEKNVK